MEPDPPGREARGLVVALGMVLFLSVGIRQGFGLFQLPATASGGLSRQAFSLAVAVQYLVWGLAGPIAGRLSLRWGGEKVLAVGGVLYATGFVLSSFSTSAVPFVLSAGLVIGLGLGCASYGIVNGLTASVAPPDSRGRALGLVGALTTLGQLLLLALTGWSLGRFGLRASLQLHGATVLAVVPIALWVLHRRRGAWERVTAPDPRVQPTKARLADLLLVCAGFGLSGFQVMFTMTHLPALLVQAGTTGRVATWMLAILSGFSFIGSLAWGRVADTRDKRRLLAVMYAVRAVAAALFPAIPPQPLALGIYFALLGMVWMSTIPVASALTADLFGVKRLALMFGYVFLAHQVGGFFGTWLGGMVVQHTGSYAPMWPLIAALLAVAAISTFFIPHAPPGCRAR